MTMATCYANYEMSMSHGISSTALVSLQHHHQQPQQQSQLYQNPHHPHQQHLSQTSQQQLLVQPVHRQSARLSLAASVVNCGNGKSAAVAAPATNNNSDTSNNNRLTSAINANNISGTMATSPLSTSTLPTIAGSGPATSQKDYAIPLHVDCSVEYELPNQPKPPAGQRVEPLLMIHPCYFRKMESQRRSPFVNNMSATARNSALLANGLSTTVPASSSSVGVTSSSTSVNGSNSITSTRRASRQSQVIQRQTVAVSSAAHYQQHLQLRPLQQQQSQGQQQQMSQVSQQAHYPIAVTHHQQQTNVTSSATTTSSVNSSATYIERFEHATVARHATVAAAVSVQHRSNQSRATSAIVNNNQSQQRSSQSQNASHNHQNLLVQNPSQWEQLAAAAAIVARSSITPVAAGVHNSQILVPNPPQTIYGKSLSTVGKRDAMISGRVYGNSTIRNASIGSLATHLNGSTKQQHCVSGGSLWGDSINGAASAATNCTTALMIDRSPMATVPSNYQAGPETTPILAMSAHYTCDDKLSGKYRQYLRAHRMHPYLAAASSSNVAVVTAANLGQTFATPSSFQHLQQQISCYNV